MKNPPVSGRIPCLGSVWKRDFDAAARAVVGAYADCAPEPCDDQAAEVESEAVALAEGVELGETLEDIAVRCLCRYRPRGYGTDVHGRPFRSRP